MVVFIVIVFEDFQFIGKVFDDELVSLYRSFYGHIPKSMHILIGGDILTEISQTF